MSAHNQLPVRQLDQHANPTRLRFNRLLFACCLASATWAQVGCQSLTTQIGGLSNFAVVTEDMGACPVEGLEEAAQSHGAVAVSSQRPPAELSKVSLPDYRIEPPDVLLIQAVRMAPKNPYTVQPLDILQIVAAGTIPEQPIAGAYQVEASGVVNLGPAYGSIKIEGLSLSRGGIGRDHASTASGRPGTAGIRYASSDVRAAAHRGRASSGSRWDDQFRHLRSSSCHGANRGRGT